MKNGILIALLTVCTALCGQDDIKKEIAVAASIENSVQRLAAYDAIADRHKLAPGTKVEKKKEGNWRIKVDTSPMDDTQSVFCFLSADEAVRSGYNNYTPTLIVRYAEGSMDAYITYDEFLGTDSTRVTLRFGKDTPKTETWNISTDHKAVFVRGNVPGFVKRLSEIDSLVVRLTPYGESPVTVSFSPNGVDQVIESIRLAAASGKG